MESAGFYTSRTWLKKHFRATETCGAINEDVIVWEVEGLEGPLKSITLSVERPEVYRNKAVWIAMYMANT